MSVEVWVHFISHGRIIVVGFLRFSVQTENIKHGGEEL